jgi:glycosyltransferase involved in cell wall biosynthesis
MRSTPKISVIIPVYNASLYLEQCLQSLMNQTFSDIEILAVNDGSTDESLEILEKVAATDSRITVLNTANNGVSYARNLGLQNAKGEYIGFCDADDWIEPQMLEKLFWSMHLNCADVVVCDLSLFQNGSKVRRLGLQNNVIRVSEHRPALLRQLLQFKFDYGNCNKLYKSSLIRIHRIHFNEGMYLWEDLLFNLQYFQKVERVALVGEALYNYRIYSTSLCHRSKSDRLSQFNFLFRSYLTELSKTQSKEERFVFRSEMARITYYQHLEEAESRAKARSKGPISLWREYRYELRRFDQALFYFPSRERKGVQGFKKALLAGGRFSLFAFFLSVKTYFHIVANGKNYKYLSGTQKVS